MSYRAERSVVEVSLLIKLFGIEIFKSCYFVISIAIVSMI
jgi:hypothetical protein